MLSKLLAGGLAASVFALGIVFWLLLASKEANGVLRQGIQSADDINLRQELVLQEVQDNHDKLLLQIEQQRIKTEAATQALAATQEGLVTAKVDFDQRMRDVLNAIPDDDLLCASEFVPAGIIDGLYDAPSGPDGP